MYRRLRSLRDVKNSQTSADWTVYGTSDLSGADEHFVPSMLVGDKVSSHKINSDR
jgi:hypothetical protein